MWELLLLWMRNDIWIDKFVAILGLWALLFYLGFSHRISLSLSLCVFRNQSGGKLWLLTLFMYWQMNLVNGFI